MLSIQVLRHIGKRMSVIPFKACASNVVVTRSLRHIALEPEYLTSKEPQEEVYEPLNVQIKGFDFTVLEKFSSFIHRAANKMDIEVEDCWAAPCKKLKIQTFKPQTTLLDSVYNLNIYERNVQVVDLPATKASIFISVIQAALPEGVDLCVRPHTQEDEDVRYVPDIELQQLRSELQALGGPVVSRKK